MEDINSEINLNLWVNWQDGGIVSCNGLQRDSSILLWTLGHTHGEVSLTHSENVITDLTDSITNICRERSSVSHSKVPYGFHVEDLTSCKECSTGINGRYGRQLLVMDHIKKLNSLNKNWEKRSSKGGIYTIPFSKKNENLLCFLAIYFHGNGALWAWKCISAFQSNFFFKTIILIDKTFIPGLGSCDVLWSCTETLWKWWRHAHVYYFTFTFMYLADTFIQSDLQCIQAIHLYCQYMCSLGIEPTTFALQTQCSNHWATGTMWLCVQSIGTYADT